MQLLLNAPYQQLSILNDYVSPVLGSPSLAAQQRHCVAGDGLVKLGAARGRNRHYVRSNDLGRAVIK